MKTIGFIGAYDKSDLIIYIAKILTVLGKKVLVIDATTNQKARYIVPVINPTIMYVTEYEDIDIAVGFSNEDDIKKYLGIPDDQEMEYDFIFVDTDTPEGIEKFDLENAQKNYFVTSFDVYSLKKGIEILNQLKEPLKMTKIFYSKEMLKEEEEYFDYLALGAKAEWNEDKIYFLLENGDYSAIIENQRLEKIKFKNLSNEYRENVIYLVNKIDDKIGERTIRGIIKNL